MINVFTITFAQLLILTLKLYTKILELTSRGFTYVLCFVTNTWPNLFKFFAL